MRKDGTLCHCCQFHSLYNTVVLLWNGWHDRWGKISFGRKTSIPEIAENCIMAMEDISCHTVNVGFPHFLNCLFSRTSLFIRMIHFCSHQRYLYVNTSFLVLILIIIISQHWFLDCQPWPISLFLQGIMRLQSFRQKEEFFCRIRFPDGCICPYIRVFRHFQMLPLLSEWHNWNG